jgi:hypothetical protein
MTTMTTMTTMTDDCLTAEGLLAGASLQDRPLGGAST